MCQIFAVGHCLFRRVTGSDPFASLLSATQAVVRKRNQPVGQNRECPFALTAKPAPNPHAYMPVIVRLPESLVVADDRGGLTNRTPRRQPTQPELRGSMLPSASGNAITRIRLV
jgi:hypothetical protein